MALDQHIKNYCDEELTRIDNKKVLSLLLVDVTDSGEEESCY